VMGELLFAHDLAQNRVCREKKRCALFRIMR